MPTNPYDWIEQYLTTIHRAGLVSLGADKRGCLDSAEIIFFCVRLYLSFK
jgi:hypothetical protein